MKYKGMICDRCGVKVTHSRVRRKRMGHIELAAPVVHIWFFKAMPSRLGALLNMKTTSLEKVIYFQDYVVVDPGETPLPRPQLLTEDEVRGENREKYGDRIRSRPRWAPKPSTSCCTRRVSMVNLARAASRRARRGLRGRSWPPLRKPRSPAQPGPSRSRSSRTSSSG